MSDQELPLKAKRAMDFSILMHDRYNTPFSKNLEFHEYADLVCENCRKHFDLIPIKGNPDGREDILAAVWIHDFITESFMEYEELVIHFGKTIADIVFAVTHNKGKTILDRYDMSYFIELKRNRAATFLANSLFIETAKLIIQDFGMTRRLRDFLIYYNGQLWDMNLISQRNEIQSLLHKKQ